MPQHHLLEYFNVLIPANVPGERNLRNFVDPISHMLLDADILGSPLLLLALGLDSQNLDGNFHLAL
jgi:hypothetical protein